MPGAILTRVRFPDATRNFSPRVKFHTDFFTAFMQTCVSGDALSGYSEGLDHDGKVSVSRSGGRMFFLQGQLPVLLLSHPFHLRVTAVARKRSRSFCQKCIHASYVCGSE